MHKKILFIAALLLIAAGVSAAERMSYGKRINLWEKRPPHKSDNPKDTAWVKVFLPEKSKATGRAIVICPGGGYQHLAMEHEGTDWAPVFNNMGIAAIVLHYRMPHGDHRIPIEDAEQAMRLVRHNAKAWGINPNDVGIMGSSAGGHLASTIATHAESKAKKKQEMLYSNDTQVNRTTPRAWIALSDDDTVVLPANGFNYYFECYRHDVEASLHVYPSGGHGWGIRPAFRFHTEMMAELKAWLLSF